MYNPYAVGEHKYVNFDVTGFVNSSPTGGLGSSLADALFAEIQKLTQQYKQGIIGNAAMMAKLKQLTAGINDLMTMINDLGSSNLNAGEWLTNFKAEIAKVGLIIKGLGSVEYEKLLTGSLDKIAEIANDKQTFALVVQLEQTLTAVMNDLNRMIYDHEMPTDDFLTDIQTLMGLPNAIGAEGTKLSKAFGPDSPIVKEFAYLALAAKHAWDAISQVYVLGGWGTDGGSRWWQNPSISDMFIDGGYKTQAQLQTAFTEWEKQLIMATQSSNPQDWLVDMQTIWPTAQACANGAIALAKSFQTDPDIEVEIINKLIRQDGILPADFPGFWSQYQDAVNGAREMLNGSTQASNSTVTNINALMAKMQAVIQVFVKEMNVPIRDVSLSINNINKRR